MRRDVPVPGQPVKTTGVKPSAIESQPGVLLTDMRSGAAANDNLHLGPSTRAAPTALSPELTRLHEEVAEALHKVAILEEKLQQIEAAELEHFDEIISSTLPSGISRWLGMDLPSRAERKFKLPVATITARA
jgi:hypothetical protein